MRWVTVLAILLAGIVVLLIMITGLASTPGYLNLTPSADGSPVYVQHDAPKQGVTALYSKNISAATPYIIVDLYSGDSGDPVSVTVITPDKTLGPFTDLSDGRKDGRIYMKISRTGGLTPGVWKFRVQSSKDIAIFNWGPKVSNTSDPDGNPTPEE
jgi:hypothetical protein